MSHMDFAHPYFGAFVMFVLTFVAFIATTALARFVCRRLSSLSEEKLKCTINECGPEVTKQPNKISTQFYMLALLFILFDVEIIFMFPWAINFKILGWFGFVAMIFFLLLLTIGFIYEWRKGALQWHSIK